MTQVRQRKQTIVDDFRTGGQRRLEQAENVELVFGEGRFTAPKVVEVTLKAGGARTLTADAIFINTGAGRRDLPSTGSIPSTPSTPPRSWSWGRCRSIC